MRVIRGWIAFLKSLKREPEHSIPLRLSVALVVMVAILGTCAQLDWPPYGMTALCLTPLGMALSYRKRFRNNWEIKAILSVLMILTLARFFVALSTSIFDPRVPLAELLLWLQTLHSWDLPCRRDLNYSLVVGLILMSIGAVLSIDLSFGWYVGAYCLAGMVALHYNYQSILAQECGLAPVRLPRPPLGRTVPLVALMGAVIFLLLPRYQSMRLRALPFNWQAGLQLNRVSEGEVVNQAYPATHDVQDFRRRARFSGDSYFGFNSIVDLNLRGGMSNELVMRVRSSRWNYFRGMTFDHYDGQFWTLSDETLRPVRAENPPLYLPTDVRGNQENVQIYYVEKAQPNLIFSAPEAAQLYFPTGEVYVDSGRAIRSPYPLEQGTVYSVISYEQQVSAERLRRLPERDGTLRRMLRYVQLPQTSDRIGKLAAEIVGERTRSFDKANAICLYLQNNYRYRTDVPAYPKDVETADYFLFEEKTGYCEQFATAMTVLCRLSKLRARYVTGYLPGTLNPLTGYQELKGSDAHAWVEVYIPNLGWVAYDPTPGAPTTPGLNEHNEDHWLILTVLKYIGRKLGLQGYDLASMARELRERIHLPVWLLPLLGVLAVGAALRGLKFGRRPRSPRDRVIADYHAMVAHLGGRERGITARELAGRFPRPEVAALTARFEEARYSSAEVSEEVARACEDALRRLKSSPRPEPDAASLPERSS